MKTCDLYWRAGILEGEGSFCWHGHKSRMGTSPVICIGMTDKDIIQRVARLFGRKVYGPYKYRLEHKAIYKTRILGAKAIGWALTLYSLLGARRKQQIRTMLITWHDRPKHSEWVKKGWVTRHANLRCTK